MKPPRRQSFIATPQTPQAMLIPDHGTTPTRRRIERRTHGADDCDFSELEFPSIALRVKSRARGKILTRNGSRGAANKLAKIDPAVVRTVRRMVAKAGEKSAPARTF